MTISYNFVADATYLRTALVRFRRQKPHRYRGPLIFGLIAICLAGAWVYARKTNAEWIAVPQFTLIGGLVGGLGGAAIGWLMQSRRLKRTAGQGVTVIVRLSDEEVTTSDAQARTHLRWTVFTRAVRFPDGIILLRGRVLRWLPDAALQDGSPEEATALVRSKLSLAEVS